MNNEMVYKPEVSVDCVVFGFDGNRFIIVGNGPKKAIKDGVVGSNQNYRTTDFQLVNE